MGIGPLLPSAERPRTAGSPAGARRGPGAQDPETRLLAEAEREHDAILALIAEQRKRDDEFLRAVIALI